MRIFFSEAAYEAAIKSKVDGLMQTEIGERIRLYSENAVFLREATAAFHGVDAKHIKQDWETIKWMGRGIRRFGDMLANANIRPHPKPGTIGEVLENLRAEDLGPEPFPAGTAFSG